MKSADQVLLEFGKKTRGLSREQKLDFASKLGIDQSLIQLLSKSSGEIDTLRKEAIKLGRVNTEQADKMAAYNDSVTRFKAGLDGLKREIAIGLLPIVSEMTADFVAFIKGLDFDSFILPRNNGALATSGVYLGTGSYRFQQLFVNESTSVSSDRRLKENIADADDAGNVIDSVQIRKFDWIENGKHQDYGVIAQEVLEVVPDAVQVPEDEDGRMGVSYETFIPMLIKEVQSLRSRVAELENV